MLPETTNDSSSKPDSRLDDGQMHKNLDLEIRQMISALTNRLASLQRVQKVAGGSSTHHHDHQEEDEEQGGLRVITLAGNNIGATMRGEMDEKTSTNNNTGLTPSGELPTGEHEALSTYVNSNFQAINNSIMMGGSYSAEDPGVHMDVSDYMEHQTSPCPNSAADSKHEGKKGKKKHKGSSSSKSDQQIEQSD